MLQQVFTKGIANLNSWSSLLTQLGMETISHADEISAQKGQYNYNLQNFRGLSKKTEISPFQLCGATWQLVLFPPEQKTMKFVVKCVSNSSACATVIPFVNGAKFPPFSMRGGKLCFQRITCVNAQFHFL